MIEQQSKDPVICEFCLREFATDRGLKIHCAKAHEMEMELAKANWAVYHGDIDGDFNYW